MKTNYIPALVTLLAGAVYCLFGIYTGVPLFDFTVQLLIVLIVFYILGTIVRFVFDNVIKGVETQKIKESETEDIPDSVNETTKPDDTKEYSEDEEGM